MSNEDWEQGDLLAEANALNATIKEYIGSHENNADREILDNYKTDIMGYLVDIGSQEFSPREDRLTKEGIEEDLRNHFRIINGILNPSGGRKLKSRRRKTRRSRNSRRKTRRRRKRAIKSWAQ